jgi:hypothetical protein
MARYPPDRRAEHAEALLGSCRGFLHADGYAGSNNLFAADSISGQPRLTEVACWAHARRAIYEVYESNGSPLAKGALDRIAELFEIETQINGAARAPGCPPTGAVPLGENLHSRIVRMQHRAGAHVPPDRLDQGIHQCGRPKSAR